MNLVSRPSCISLAIASLFSTNSFSEETDTKTNTQAHAGIERIQVTASRRLTAVEDLPYNISAIDQDSLARNGISDQAELGLSIPGLTVVDTGARNDSPITIRGLSVDELSANDGGGNGGTVSVYVNDTPLLVDLSVIDVNRIEVLRGPQGTLYGAGSLGGTLKYVLNTPQLDETELSLSTKQYHVEQSSGVSQQYQLIGNLPIIEDKLAIRVAYDWVDEQGFIDYTETLNGSVSDVNSEKSINGKLALSYQFNDEINALFTHIQQKQDVGGRQAVNTSFTGDKYSNSARFVEPAKRDVSFDTLELSWAGDDYTIVSSSSYSTQTDLGQRDQTDLLITSVWPGYADYSEFNAFTKDSVDNKVFTQEFRIQSDSSETINWVAGLYYTNEDNWGESIEYTPGYPEYLGLDRPDNIEYFEQETEKVIEKAMFGELTWFINDDWNVTVGARTFDLSQQSYQCLDFPIDEGMAGNEFSFECSNGSGDNQDSIFKISSFYQFNDDINVYFTVSEGFRRGGSNGVPEGGQVGFSEDEKSYDPDSVTNYELGWHATLLDNNTSDSFQLGDNNSQVSY